MGHFINTCIASSLLTTSIQCSDSKPSLTWTPEAMMSCKNLSDVQISPDNESVLFVSTQSQIEKTQGSFLSRIYKAKATALEKATALSPEEASSSQPRWSPDGKWVAFLSKREKINSLYLIPSEGGSPVCLTQNKKDIQTFAWSPDGVSIALVMADEIEKTQAKRSLAYEYQKKVSVNRLWLLDVFSEAPSLTPLTPDKYDIKGLGDFGTINVEFDWAPNGKEITFAHAPDMGFDSFYLDSSLATLNISTKTITPIAKKSLYESLPRYSPDGKWIAYLSGNSSKRYAVDRTLAVYSVDGKEHRFLKSTWNEGCFLAGPSFLGWDLTGNHLVFFEPKKTKFHIALLPIDGSTVKEVETGDTFFLEPSLSCDRSMLAFVSQTPSTPPEVCVAKLDDFKPIQLSSFNESLLDYPKIDTQVISWKSQDGIEIEGLLTYPVSYSPGKQYPLLVCIHGGPMGFFTETFVGTQNFYPLAAFAQEGFFIFRPNPRGSTGYGKEFRSANYGDWGGKDFLDILSGVDSILAKGMIDAEKLGIMGWSYGGYMTAWSVCQTSIFKAASMGAGVYNLISFNGTTDLHRFLTDYLGTMPDHLDLYTSRSPTYHVRNVTTPCLIQHGTADLRVPVSQAYELYHALNREGKNPVLTLYPEMGHRFPDSNMLLESMKENLSWFQMHLLDP